MASSLMKARTGSGAKPNRPNSSGSIAKDVRDSRGVFNAGKLIQMAKRGRSLGRY